MKDAYDVAHERAFGRIQGEKVVDSRPSGTGRRYECEVCAGSFMSDEALQLHKVAEATIAQTVVIRELIDMLSQKLG